MSSSPREELLRLQKNLYRRNQRLIRESVFVEEPDFKAYEARYKRYVKNFERIASIKEMLDACRQAEIIYIGDYHTCNQSQRSFTRILKAIAQSHKKAVIGLELFHSRHQKFLDEYLKNKISEKTFLKKVALQKHWVFDLWDNFKPVIDFARDHEMPMVGIDVSPRNSNLHRRDADTARYLAKLAAKYPDHKIFVFIGDLHIAPPHLPKEVEKALRAEGLRKKDLILYQNSEPIYWKLAALGKEDHAEIVRVDARSFCRMHTPPVICQRSYLNWLEREEGEIDYSHVRQQFVDVVDRISNFLSIHLGKEKETVEVYTSGDLSFLERLQKSKRFSKGEIAVVKNQIALSESYYIPKLRIVYLSSLSLNHVAEEATHFMKHICSGEEKPRDPFDAFYANVLHEALGFFGSKIINHKRKCNHEQNYERLLHYLQKHHYHSEQSLEYETALLVVRCKQLEAKGEAFSDISMLDRMDLFLSVSHALGYMMGDRLYYALLEGVLTKADIRHLFYHPWRATGQPFQSYWKLLTQMRDVKIPKRM
ncbi:MAG: ChaN family lipoprotein [Deltaproteobacteria bacterium]|nr:ChaN family lipoprotein [Deltaproteobacteria bacterium]